MVTIVAGFLRRPEPLQEHRADHGVDHLAGSASPMFRPLSETCGSRQSVANDVRVGRDDRPRAITRSGATSLCACPIPAALGVWPAVILLARVFLGRARLSQPRRALAFLPAGGRLFRPDLHRHVPVRLRDMAGARRSLSRWCSARSRALRRSKCASGLARNYGCGRSAPGFSTARAVSNVDDRVRAACCSQAFSTMACWQRPEWGNLESALAAHMPAFGDLKLMRVRTAGPDWVLASCSSAPTSQSAPS